MQNNEPTIANPCFAVLFAGEKLATCNNPHFKNPVFTDI